MSTRRKMVTIRKFIKNLANILFLGSGNDEAVLPLFFKINYLKIIYSGLKLVNVA